MLSQTLDDQSAMSISLLPSFDALRLATEARVLIDQSAATTAGDETETSAGGTIVALAISTYTPGACSSSPIPSSLSSTSKTLDRYIPEADTNMGPEYLLTTTTMTEEVTIEGSTITIKRDPVTFDGPTATLTETKTKTTTDWQTATVTEIKQNEVLDAQSSFAAAGAYPPVPSVLRHSTGEAVAVATETTTETETTTKFVTTSHRTDGYSTQSGRPNSKAESVEHVTVPSK